MAYQLFDGFDNYGNNYQLIAGYPWTYLGNYSNTSPATNIAETTTADYQFAPPGSLPGACVNIAGGNYIRYNLVSNPETLHIGFGIKFSSLPPSSPQQFLTLYDTGNYQAALALTSNGALQFYVGNGAAQGGGGVVLYATVGPASPNSTITAGVWYNMQIAITIAAASAGSIALYLNGSPSPLISGSSLTTSPTGNNYATQLAIGPGTMGATKYDDFYCFDSTGTFLNSTLTGASPRIITKMPASAGTYTNWTPTGLGANYQNAAVQPPSTSDYNANNTGGTKDSYTMQVASLGVAPYAVLVRASLEKDDGATHTPSIFVRSSSTDSTGVATAALSSSYLFYDTIFQNDPSTSTSWTATGADNAQAGIIEG